MREVDPCLEQKRGDDTVAVIPGKRVSEVQSFDLGSGCPERCLERTRIHIVADRAQEDKAVTVGVLGIEGDAADARTLGRELLREGYSPIVFCRYIATAKYLAAWLPKLLAKEVPGLRVAAVTGEVGDEQRRELVGELSAHPIRVLVATDCLSEGINLQEHFNAVLHYDLPWNPNRLEQREGRIDRFGQPRSQVRAIVLYGADNQVDLVVLDVLIRKARTIRSRLGISVPVPAQSDGVMQAMVDTFLLRGPSRAQQLQLALVDPEVSRLHGEWERAADREGQQLAYYSQHGIQPDDVAREIEATDPVLGDPTTVRRFLENAVQRLGGRLEPARQEGVFTFVPGGEMERRLRDRGDLPPKPGDAPLQVAFEPLAGAAVLTRTHPIVAAYCEVVLGDALSPEGDRRFPRSGAIFTTTVRVPTAVLLVRLRYLLRERTEEYAEEVMLVAFEERDGELAWLEPWDGTGRDLLEAARPAGNMTPEDRAAWVKRAIAALEGDDRWHEPLLESRVTRLLESNNRLRTLVRQKALRIEPHRPPDILGCYVLVPAGAPIPSGQAWNRRPDGGR